MDLLGDAGGVFGSMMLEGFPNYFPMIDKENLFINGDFNSAKARLV